MFAKLLKHEMKAAWRVLGLLCITSLVLSILGGGSCRYLVSASNHVSDTGFLEVACGIMLFFSILFIMFCGVAALFVLVGRFYKSRFTDEGYLTFTLPVTTHQVLLSSLVSTAVNMLVVGIVVALSVVGLVLIGASADEDFLEGLHFFFTREWRELWLEFWNTVVMSNVAQTVQLLICGVLSYLMQIVIVMLAITIGALAAKKHKVLMAILFYYLIQFVMSVFGTGVLIGTLDTMLKTETFLIGPIIMELVAMVGGYFLMHYLVSRKLNLP